MSPSIDQFRSVALSQANATRIRLGPDGQLAGKARSVAARLGAWFGEVFSSGKARNREAIESFIQTVRSEKGPAAGDIVHQYLARRLEQGKPLAPQHVTTGLKLTGVLVEGAPSLARALESLGVGDDFTKIGSGGQGTAYAVQINQGKESMQGVLKTFVENPHTLRFDPLREGKLTKVAETAAAYIGTDIPGLIRPDFYIVQHQRVSALDNGDSLSHYREASSMLLGNPAGGSPHQHGAAQGTQFSVVAGGRQFRRWATERLVAGDHPKCVGVVMPKATGQPVLDLASVMERDREQSRPESPLLLTATIDSLATLAGMARHGFRHSDIKPENVRYNAQSRVFEIFDQGSMVKMPRAVDGIAPSLDALTSVLYRDPGFKEQSGAGVEYDLFATGVTMLEASLRERGLHDIAHKVLQDVKAATAGIDEAMITERRLQNLVDWFANWDESPEEADAPVSAQPQHSNPRLGLLASIRSRVEAVVGDDTPAAQLALRMIDAALRRESPVVERFDPNRPDAHPFGSLYQLAAARPANG
jgi:hypothetical protein